MSITQLHTSRQQHQRVIASTKPNPKNKAFITLRSSLVFILLLTILAFLLLHHNNLTSTIYTPFSSNIKPWHGDVRAAEFSWNRLQFSNEIPPPISLKIAVFSRKWPNGAAPGGMERHAYILHSALAQRGHKVHVFTSPLGDTSPTNPIPLEASQDYPVIHCHEGKEPGRWLYNKAWEQYIEEDQKSQFDVIHSESVSLPHWLAKDLPNLAVSWHGIAMESLQSSIYLDLIRNQDEKISPAFNNSLYGMIPKVINEIRFFRNYAHHVATSDSSGEMLRDVYQIPTKRVHVIVNGVDAEEFKQDKQLGTEFRSRIGIPQNASLVLGITGRLVKDKGHPILYEAFSLLKSNHSDVFLIVAGSGPWLQRYKDLGPQVITLGSMNKSELRSFYNAIDIFVSPTLRPQGLDQTLLEAVLSGKPVMASRLPSIKGTLIVDDEYGFMFSPNVESLLESMEIVVAEGAKRLAERGKACREYAVSMFTLTKMALAYERLFLCINNATFCIYP